AGIGVTVATALDRHDRIVLGLETARARFDRGLITAPENDSAVAALRAVLSVDPGNRAAEALMVRCAMRLAAVAKTADAARMKNVGRQYLTLALEIRPEEPDWLALRDRWNRDD
ncbi:MAG: hypothetical protein ACKOBM_13485, partial [Gammaproteobacteria bacterium]